MFLKKLYEPLERAIEESVLENTTDVQKKLIPQIKSGNDVLCIDEEGGNGTTTALVITTINKLKEAYKDVPRAMIVVPSQAIGEKMEEMFAIYGKYTNLRVHTAYDTRLIEDQRDKIYFGTDVVIGTLTQINNLFSISGINVGKIQLMAIDDADQIAKDAALSPIERLYQCLPKCQRIIIAKKNTNNIDRIVENNMYVF